MKALSNAREMDAEFDAKEQDKNCTQRREDETGRVKASGCRRREHVRYGPAEDGADDTEHDGPEDGHMHVHHRLCYDSGDQADQDIPDKVKHKSSTKNSELPPRLRSFE